MLDEKDIGEIKRNTERMIRRGSILKEGSGRFVEFFINNSGNSFNVFLSLIILFLILGYLH